MADRKSTHLVARVAAVATIFVGSAAGSAEAGTPADPATHTRETLGFYPGFGDVDAIRSLEQEVGFDVNVVVQFGGRKEPSDMVGSTGSSLASLSEWISERDPLYSIAVPLAFGEADSRTAEGRLQVIDNLTRTVNGEYDAAYEQVAYMLLDYGLGDAVIRIGHEFDAVWFPWSAQPSCESYINAFRHVADRFRMVSPEFRIEYSGGMRGFADFAECAYPGDEYVDIVGLTIFDRGGPIRAFSRINQTWLDPAAVWAEQFLPALQFHHQFAVAHGKPVGYPEWGAVATNDGAHGGDNPAFIRSMAEWLRSLPTSGPGALTYHAYFMDREADLNLMEQASAAFFQEFGSAVS